MICSTGRSSASAPFVRQRAQHVALGDDAGLCARDVPLASAGDERTYSEEIRSFVIRASASSKRSVGGDELAGDAHDVADAVAIGVAVDAPQRALGIDARSALRRLDPAGAVLLVEHVGERAAGPLGFGQGADAAVAQLRQQRQENARRRSASPSAECRSATSTPSQAARLSSE